MIAQQPSNVGALIRKGDLRAGAGDQRAATLFYRAAIRAASAQGPLSDELSAALARAEAACIRASHVFQDYLEEALAQAGFPQGKRPPRFQESLDILMGRRQAHMQLQQPRAYYYPGLPQRRYYERSEFDWVSELEAQTDAIRAEALALAKDETRFTPYVVSDPKRPPRETHGLLDNPDWSTLPLWVDGAPAGDAVTRCPNTFAALGPLDLAQISKRAPWIVFSKLTGRARIPPHTGMINARLICHLPLVVPAGCEFKVGGETRRWHEGELMIFDDTVVHEAANNGTSDRIVLILDIWRPELDPDERQAITAIFEAIDAYNG
ncbi:MAG: aspartyl/asparaginyl beta-hydroxylase domain-containing protein [Sphingomicrobium sp.]